MRFLYEPEHGLLSLYVKKQEFALAANDTEYKVMSRAFEETDINVFLEEFIKFSRDMLNSMSPKDKLQDVLAISLSENAYIWTSLVRLEDSSEPQNFLNMLLDYGVAILQKQSKNQKNFLNDLDEEDKAKLQLSTALLN